VVGGALVTKECLADSTWLWTGLKYVGADHWEDIAELKAKGTESVDLEDQLSENERTIAEAKAACLIIDARINAYNESLTFLQTRLEGLNERVLQAEKAYAVSFLCVLHYRSFAKY
jgi:hypothetical protein